MMRCPRWNQCEFCVWFSAYLDECEPLWVLDEGLDLGGLACARHADQRGPETATTPLNHKRVRLELQIRAPRILFFALYPTLLCYLAVAV